MPSDLLFTAEFSTNQLTFTKLFERRSLSTVAVKECNIQWTVFLEYENGKTNFTLRFALPAGQQKMVIAASTFLNLKNFVQLTIPSTPFMYIAHPGNNELKTGSLSLDKIERFLADFGISTQTQFCIQVSVKAYTCGAPEDEPAIRRNFDAHNLEAMDLQNYFAIITTKEPDDYQIQCDLGDEVPRRNGRLILRGVPVTIRGVQWSLNCDFVFDKFKPDESSKPPRRPKFDFMTVACRLECQMPRGGAKKHRVRVCCRVRRREDCCEPVNCSIVHKHYQHRYLVGYAKETYVDLEFSSSGEQQCAFFSNDVAEQIHFAEGRRLYRPDDYSIKVRQVINKEAYLEKALEFLQDSLMYYTLEPKSKTILFECNIEFLDDADTSQQSSAAGGASTTARVASMRI